MKNMKRWIAGTLAAIMMLSSIPSGTAYASEAETVVEETVETVADDQTDIVEEQNNEADVVETVAEKETVIDDQADVVEDQANADAETVEEQANANVNSDDSVEADNSIETDITSDEEVVNDETTVSDEVVNEEIVNEETVVSDETVISKETAISDEEVVSEETAISEETTEQASDEEITETEALEADADLTAAKSVDYDAVEEYIVKQLRAERKKNPVTAEMTIDISSCKVPCITDDDKNNMNKVIGYLLNGKYADLYFLKPVGAHFYRLNNTVTEVVFPCYEEMNETVFQNAAQKALATVNDNMSDFQKIVVLHDYLVKICKYDKTTEHCVSVYGALVEGKAKCQGYAEAYRYLMEKVGIECYNVRYPGHVWNLVKLDGEYYHVDVTNDSTTYTPSYVTQYNFMLNSDAIPAYRYGKDPDTWYISNGPKYTEQTDIRATSTLYDDAPWKTQKTPIVFDDNGNILTEGTYTITYVLNGGINNPENPSTYTKGTRVEFKNPSREGYQFDGWYVNADFITKITAISEHSEGGNKTLYAKWTKIETPIETETETETAETYTITYVLNGGINNPENPATYAKGTRVEFKNPSRDGYQFDGWYLDEVFTSNRKITAISEHSNGGDRTLYAKWTKIETPVEEISEESYTITYVLNGGTNNSENPATYVKGTRVEFKDPTREGYQFDGWYVNENFATKITALSVNSSGDKTIYAKWTESETYAITYVLNGGTNNPENPATYTEGTEVWFKDPTKEGYQFDGWYLDANFMTRVKAFSKNSSGDKTIYAKWIETYTITYVLNGGINNPENPSAYVQGTRVEFKDPTREGYQFDGWYLDEKFTENQKVRALSEYSSGDKTIYAKWTESETYTITYVLNGGTNNSENPATYTQGTRVEFKDPTREGYQFGGWYLDEKFTENQKVRALSENSSGDKTIYAKWIETYTITYVLNGGKNNSNNPATYAKGTEVQFKDPTREGYQFDGWYLEANYLRRVSALSKNTSGDKILYAKWIYEGSGELDVRDIADMYYTGSACKPEVNVYDGETLLKAGKDYQVKYYNNVNANIDGVLKGGSFNAALPYVEIIGKGNYTGTVKVNFNILKASISDGNGNPAANVVLKVTDSFVASNKAKKPFSSIKLNKAMKQDVDFTLRLTTSDGKELPGAVIPADSKGTFLLKIIGKNNYEGTIEIIIYVADKESLPKNIKFTAKTISVNGITDKIYTGKALVQENVTLTYGGKQLFRGVDYTVSYTKNVNKGTAAMTFRGIEKAGFIGSFKKTFKITAADITSANYTGKLSVSYSKAGAKPVITLTSMAGKRLVNGKDYTLKYTDNKAVGTGTVVVKGKGNYTGSLPIPFSIVEADLNDLTVKTVSVAYNEKKAADYEYKPAIKLMDGKKALKAGVDYQIEYRNNTQAEYEAYRNGGTNTPCAVITAKDGSSYRLDGQIVIPLPVYQNKLTKKNVSVQVEASECVYTGRQVRPSVEVRFMGTRLVEGRDYTLSYGENNVSGKNKGSVTISGIGPDYGGDVVVKFEISRKTIRY